jgi:hypothetical protein
MASDIEPSFWITVAVGAVAYMAYSRYRATTARRIKPDPTRNPLLAKQEELARACDLGEVDAACSTFAWGFDNDTTVSQPMP